MLPQIYRSNSNGVPKKLVKLVLQVKMLLLAQVTQTTSQNGELLAFGTPVADPGFWYGDFGSNSALK